MNVRAIGKDEWAKKANKRTRKGNETFAQLIEFVRKNGGAVIEGVADRATAKNLQSSLAAVGRRAGFPLASSYSAETHELLVVKRTEE